MLNRYVSGRLKILKLSLRTLSVLIVASRTNRVRQVTRVRVKADVLLLSFHPLTGYDVTVSRWYPAVCVYPETAPNPYKRLLFLWQRVYSIL